MKEVPLRQEREDTTRMRLLVAHSDDINFVVNINSLHNHDVIRLATPDAVRFSLPCPRPDPAPIYKQAAQRVRSDKAWKAQEKAIKDAAVKKVKESASKPTAHPAPGPTPVVAPPNADQEAPLEATTSKKKKAPKSTGKGKARAMSVDEPAAGQPTTESTVPTSTLRPAKGTVTLAILLAALSASDCNPTSFSASKE